MTQLQRESGQHYCSPSSRRLTCSRFPPLFVAGLATSRVCPGAARACMQHSRDLDAAERERLEAKLACDSSSCCVEPYRSASDRALHGAINFFHRRQPAHCLTKPVRQDADHPFLLGRTPQVTIGPIVDDELFQIAIDRQHFLYPDAPAVTRVRARG